MAKRESIDPDVAFLRALGRELGSGGRSSIEMERLKLVARRLEVLLVAPPRGREANAEALRDRFALAVLQGWVQSLPFQKDKNAGKHELMVKLAYDIADAAVKYRARLLAAEAAEPEAPRG